MILSAGWIGTAFVMWGIWLTGRKQRSGFIIGVIGGILWAIKAVYTLQIDLITVNMLIILTQLHAWWKWGKNARPDLDDAPRPVRE